MKLEKFMHGNGVLLAVTSEWPNAQIEIFFEWSFITLWGQHVFQNQSARMNTKSHNSKQGSCCEE